MTSSTQPGWYDDPENANGQRYWDGQAWTPHRQQKSVSQPAPAPGFAPPAPPSQQAGWQPPGYPPAGPPPKGSSNLPLIIGVIVGVIVLAGGLGLWLGWPYLFGDKSAFAKPEDQIRNVVQRITDDFNASKFAHDPAIQCKANTDSDDKSAKEAAQIKDQAGTLSTSVSNIHVTGDSATADVVLSFPKLSQSTTKSMKFIKEDGGWKECTPPEDDSQGDGDSGN